VSGSDGFSSAGEVPEDARGHLGDLLLVLADTKRLLGMRYADWILGAPALEAGIACSAMAQDEWGHGRIHYAMLRDFGHDPDYLEHGREPSQYRNCQLLDGEVDEWPELLALNLLLDTALAVQFEAMRESRFEPIHYKVSKILEEERFHFQHAKGWTARLAGTGSGRRALEVAFRPAWEECLRWFGPPEGEASRVLREREILDATPDELRGRWMDRVGPVVAAAGLELAEREDGRWRSLDTPEWNGWKEGWRRSEGASGPSEQMIRRVRGDRNRPLLLD